MAGVVEHHSPVRCKLHSTAIAFTVFAAFAAFAVLIWLESKRGLYLGIAVAMVIAMLTDAVFARRAVAELVIEVHPPPDGCVGERVRWPVQTTGWNRPVVLRPLLVGGLGGYLVDDPLPGVMTIIPTRKGTLGVLALDVVTTGPLGLIGAGRRLFQELAQPLCFGPKPIEAEGRWPWTVPTGVGAVHSTPRGDELFRAVRPYRRGDDRRRVDWKTTARHGELMVRELDGTGTARIRVVADLGPHGPDADRAAGLAAWVATTALAAGYEVELIHLDGSDQVPILIETGRVFGQAPTVGSPRSAAPQTVASVVRSAADVSRRLAMTAYGHPDPPADRTHAGCTCHVSAAEVTWT